MKSERTSAFITCVRKLARSWDRWTGRTSRREIRTLAMCAIILSLATVVVGVAYFRHPARPVAVDPWTPPPTRSEFENQLAVGDYPSADPPAKPALLRWDFSGERAYSYDVSWKIKDRFDSGQDSGASVITVSRRGRLLVKSQGNRSATMILDGMKLAMEVKTGKPVNLLDQQSSSEMVQHVDEDGSVESPENGIGRILDMFLLPPKSLKLGESVDVTKSLPFSVDDSGLSIKGSVRGIVRTRLEDYVMIDGHTCAHLSSDIDISELDVPKDVRGNFVVAMRGKSVVYLDLVDRCLVSASVALVHSFREERPLPATAGVNLPPRERWARDSDSLVTIIRSRAPE